MRKINANDFATMELLSRHYKGMPNPIIDAVRKLTPGEGLVFEKAEWERKTHPAPVIYADGKKNGAEYSVRQLADQTGFAVLRKA